MSDESIRRLSDQVCSIENDEIRAVFLRIIVGFIQLPSVRMQPDSHGYIAEEVRAYFGDEWYLSAVLNKQWVLFYFRWPALRDGFASEGAVLESFPKAEGTKGKDIKLRVATLAEATRVIDFLSNRS